MTDLTPDEKRLIEELRRYRRVTALDYGVIPCIIYVKDGKMQRVEIEAAKASIMLT